MNNDGTGLAFDNQASAEHALFQERTERILLIERLETANQSIDSVRLAQIISDARAAI